ncbi:MAG: helix-turn-helix domain-containing protein [Negativicutes bacterium]|nr:helix-turn-helix domain-containing protein [Negativicutes bacterium]
MSGQSKEPVKVVYMTGRQLAEYLQVGKSKVYEMAKRQEIPYVMIGSVMRFRSDEIDAHFSHNPNVV